VKWCQIMIENMRVNVICNASMLAVTSASPTYLRQEWT